MKKIISLVMVIAMIAALCITVSAEDIPTDGLVAYLSFDELAEGNVYLGDGVVAKLVMNDGSEGDEIDPDSDLTIPYEGVGGNSLGFDQYWGYAVEITKEDGSGIFDGLESFTVSIMSNNSTIDSPHWLFFAVPNEDGVPHAQVYQQEKYIGLLEKNTTLTAEFYNCAGSRTNQLDAASIIEADTWHVITLTFDAAEKVLTVYYDGDVAATKSDIADDHTVADILGDDYTVYLGRSTWGTGEYGEGMVDEFRLYNRALSADEVAALAAQVDNVTESEPPQTEAKDPTPADPDDDGNGNANEPADNNNNNDDGNTTDAPAGTDAQTDGEDEGGCGSTLGAAAAIIALTSVFGCAIVKKH